MVKLKNLFLLLPILLFVGCGTNVAILEEQDFKLQASLDLADNVQVQVYSAHNPDVDNTGSKEDIWEGGGLMTYLTTAQKYNISSSSAADTDGGTGGWNVFVIGLDENYVFVQELVTLNGLTPVQTVNTFIRPRTMVVLQAGSSGYNEGIITAISADTGDVQEVIDIEESTSKSSTITVPANHTLVLNKLMLTTTKTGGQNPIVEFKGKIRLGGIANASWIETFDVKIDTSVNDHIIIDNFIGNDLNEKTDFRIEVTSTVDNTDVNARLWWYFVKND